MNPVRVAAVQAKPRSHTFEEMMAGGDVAHAVELFKQAIASPVDIVCFPELYPMRGERELRAMAARAGVHVICGLREERGEVAYNTATLIGPNGDLIGRQRKVFPTAIEVSRGIVPGDRYEVFETTLGRIGMIICADLPFSRRGIVELCRQRADLVFNPSWWFALGEAYPASIIGRHLEYGVPIFGVDIAQCALAVKDEQGVHTLFPEAGGYTTVAIPPPCRTLDELGEWFRNKSGGSNSMAGFVSSLKEGEDILYATVDVEMTRAFPGYFYSESAPSLAEAELLAAHDAEH
ncbi:MAG: carbon-nitrogen hydrolase family protein [Chloroflexota bacterium]